MDLELLVLSATTASEINTAFATLMQRSVDGLVMGNDQFFQVRQDQVIALAARYRLPTIYEWPEFVKALAALPATRPTASRCFVRWEFTSVVCSTAPNRPELPVMQPTKFELVVNLKTARFGLKITELFQQLADEVIE